MGFNKISPMWEFQIADGESFAIPIFLILPASRLVRQDCIHPFFLTFKSFIVCITVATYFLLDF